MPVNFSLYALEKGIQSNLFDPRISVLQTSLIFFSFHLSRVENTKREFDRIIIYFFVTKRFCCLENDHLIRTDNY